MGFIVQRLRTALGGILRRLERSAFRLPFPVSLLDGILRQVVREVRRLATSPAPLRTRLVHHAVRPAALGLLDVHALPLEGSLELVLVLGHDAGVLDGIPEPLIERRTLAAPFGPCRLPVLRERRLAHHGEAVLNRQPVVDGSDALVVHAVGESLARRLVVVADGRVDMEAPALAVGVDGDPARGLRRYFLAQEVSVLHRPLDVLRLVDVHLVRCP